MTIATETTPGVIDCAKCGRVSLGRIGDVCTRCEAKVECLECEEMFCPLFEGHDEHCYECISDKRAEGL